MTYQTEVDQRTVNINIQSEWGIERLDVDAYLKRVAYEGPLEPTDETLQALHRSHTAAIPFENLDILLERGVSLDIDDIQEKILRNHRGGYCFEHNLLFAALLERVGFGVRRLAARVQPEKPGPRTHMCLAVEAGASEWLADVGFGTTLIEAVPLQDGAISQQGGWTYGINQEEPDAWRLRSSGPDGWSNEYGFTLEPQRPIDYIVFNHYTSTHPGSPFVNQIVALRKTQETQYALRGRSFTVETPGQPTEERVVNDAEFADVLKQTFGIVLEPGDLTDLLAVR